MEILDRDRTEFETPPRDLGVVKTNYLPLLINRGSPETMNSRVVDLGFLPESREVRNPITRSGSP
jgi:hypothetical protein